MIRYLRLALHSLCLAAAFAQGGDPAGQAAAAFDKNDCKTASALYREALDAARPAGQWDRVALYQRRIGICTYRAGDLDGAAGAYRDGVEAAVRSGDREMELENTHGLSLALLHLSRLDEALEAALRAQQLAANCGHTVHRERARFQLNLVYGAMGRWGLAQTELEEMLRESRAAGLAGEIAHATDSLAILLSDSGQSDEAIRLSAEFIAKAPASDHADLARLYYNLGQYQQRAGRIADAERSFDLAARQAAQDPSSRYTWQLRIGIPQQLGTLRFKEGRFADAEVLLRQALTLAEKSGELTFVIESRAGLAQALVGLRRLDEASDMAEAAVATARRTDSSVELLAALSSLGQVRRAQRRSAEALSAFEEAAALVETLRIGAPGDAQGLEALFAQSQPVYQNLVDLVLEAGDTTKALLWVEKSKARVLNDILQRGGLAEVPAMSPEERREESRLYSNLFRAAPGSEQAKDSAIRLDTFRRQLYTTHPELALQRADFAPAGVDQWRSLLPGDSAALLEFFVLPKGVALFVVRRGSVVSVRLASGEATLASDIRRFRQQLALRDVRESELARSLYSRLFGSAAALRAVAGTTDWIVSPDGPLWELPFQALLDASGKRLLERRTIAYTPSFTALAAIRGRSATSPSGLDLFAIANPALPEAGAEVLQVASLFPPARTVVAMGVNSNADSYRRNAPRAAVVHVAAHAEFNSISPMYSWLRLSPSENEDRLTASELLRIPLHARLIVLSACETARGKPDEGEGLVGMSWALAGAGAAASLLSHWKVDSTATEALMLDFHRELRKTQSPAVALRSAALATMNRPGMRHPFYWAAFAAFGDGYR